MAKGSKKAVDFENLKANLGKEFKPVQILDSDAKVVNEDLMANFSNDQLVNFMKKN